MPIDANYEKKIKNFFNFLFRSSHASPIEVFENIVEQ